MQQLGEELDRWTTNGEVPDGDAGLAFSLTRFWRDHGVLTVPMQVSAFHLLEANGVDLGDMEPPDDDDSEPYDVPFVERPPEKENVDLDKAKLKRKSSVRFYCNDDYIIAKTPFSLKELCKSVPGRRWNSDLKAWVWPKGPICAISLRDTFAEYDPDWDEEFAGYLGELAAAAQHKNATDLPDIESVDTVAWMHQRQAYYFVKELAGAALWMDMGTGKSLVAVARAMDIGGNILILCPDKVVGVWPREFRRHGRAPIHFENGLRPKKRGLGMNKLSVKDRMAAFQELRDCTCGRPHVYITNYETTIRSPLETWLKNREWDLLIADEAHRIKSATGSQSKLIGQVARKTSNRLELTGTPTPHSPLDVFGQFRAIDPSIFGNSFTAFKARYAIMGGYEGREVLGMNPATIGELWEKCYRFAFEVKADDVLDLPEMMEDQYLTCTMDGAQAKAYTDMAKQMAAEFPGQTVSDIVQRMLRGETVAPNAAVKAMRLRQITGGSLKDDESGQTLILGDAKEKLLADWMADFPEKEPLVVFAEFTHDIGVIRRIAEKQGRRVGEVSGNRNDLTADSEYPEDVDVLAVQIASGGAGVDLTRSCYGCYYSVGYNNGHYRQSRARLHRPGQTRSVRFWHLLCEGTVDLEVYATLEGREDVNREFHAWGDQ